MELKNFFAQDIQGNVIASPTVYVYEPDTTTAVQGLKSATGSDLGNPFIGSPLGHVQFAAPDGDYDMRVVGAGRDSTVRVRFIDAAGIRARLDEVLEVAEAAIPLPDQTSKAGCTLFTDGETAAWIAGYTKAQIDAGFYTKAQADALLGGRASADLSNVSQANARNKVGAGSMAYRNFTVSNTDPVGGANGDIHFKV